MGYAKKYFKELDDTAKYLKAISHLRRGKLLTTPTRRDLDNLLKFARVRGITAIILIGTRYNSKKYPRKVTSTNWWPWMEFVIFHSDTGNWWITASGNTSRLREVHNTIVDFLYTGGTHVPSLKTRFCGRTVVYDMDRLRAKIAEAAPLFLVGEDIGMNYKDEIKEVVMGELFVDYSTTLDKNHRKIYLARYPDMHSPVEVLF